MSFLKLDSEREKHERLAEIEHEEQTKTARANGSDTSAFLSLFAFVGLCVGYYVADERQMSIPTIIGTAIGLFLFSGLVALLFNWLIGKWKLAFAITFCLLAISSITSFVYESNRKSSDNKPAFYQKR
jgi:hypothetical protein